MSQKIVVNPRENLATEGNSEDTALNKGSVCTMKALNASQKIIVEADKIVAGPATEEELESMKDYVDV